MMLPNAVCCLSVLSLLLNKQNSLDRHFCKATPYLNPGLAARVKLQGLFTPALTHFVCLVCTKCYSTYPFHCYAKQKKTLGHFVRILSFFPLLLFSSNFLQIRVACNLSPLFQNFCCYHIMCKASLWDHYILQCIHHLWQAHCRAAGAWLTGHTERGGQKSLRLVTARLFRCEGCKVSSPKSNWQSRMITAVCFTSSADISVVPLISLFLISIVKMKMFSVPITKGRRGDGDTMPYKKRFSEVSGSSSDCWLFTVNLSCTKQLFSTRWSLNRARLPPNFFFQLQGILQRWVLMVCLQSVPVRVPSLVPSPQSPSLATHTLHCHSPQSDLRSFFPAVPNIYF